MKKLTTLISLIALGAASFAGLASPALAAPVEPLGSPADSETWNRQSIITTDGTAYAGEIAFDNVREGYPHDGSTITVPAGERFSFLKYTDISDIFYVEEAHTRTARVTNNTSAPFTVTNISADLVYSEYEGESETHQADADGTTVLTAPQGDIVVAAGETVYVQFITIDPIVSTVRTNADGEVTGMGSVTRFNYTILGKDYWFSESAGFGSARFNRFQVPNPQEITEDMFPPCEWGGGTGTPEPELTIGLCSWYSTQSIQFDSSYYSPTAPLPEEETPDVPDEPVIVPVTVSGTVKDAAGNPMSGFAITLRDSTGEVTHTDVSDAVGFWSVSEVYPEHYSAYILVGDVWTLIMSPEDFDVEDEPLSDKNFVLDRDIVAPPTEEPTPTPTPTPVVVPPVVTPEPTPEVETPVSEPDPEPTEITDVPAEVPTPEVGKPVSELTPNGTPATVPPTKLAETGFDIRGVALTALLLLFSGTLAAIATFVSKKKRFAVQLFASPTLLAWQSKDE